MVILDNIIFSLQKIGGISLVWSELIKNIKSKDVKYLEYSNADYNLFRRSLNLKNNEIIKEKYFNKIISQLISPKIKIDYPFIFHSSYFRICKNPKAINVTTVHDFIYEHKNHLSLREKLRIKLDYKAIRKSQAIVCVSENTKKDLFKFLPHINLDKVYVIHNGVSEDYYKLNLKPYPEFSNYVLFIGGRQDYKNFEFTVEFLKDTDFELIICGSPLNEKEFQFLEENLKGKYKNIIYPSNEELNKIYNSVFCLFYPSSYEGFGLPVLEAQRAGCPVIAMNSSSIPEIIGKNGLMINSKDINESINILRRLKDNNFRNKIIRDGIENSKKFSWQKMAHEYENLYNSLLLKYS